MKFTVAIIGTGNVAWHLSSALENAGHEITEIYGRNIQNARQLAARLYATEVQDHLDFTESNANLFIIAVSDHAIAQIAEAVLLPEGSILVHTSGTMPLDILSYSSADFTGVLYPLQGFSKKKEIPFEEVPFLLEAEDKDTLRNLKKLCKSLKAPSYEIRSKDRRTIHVAAVFAANFTNHMVYLAESIMQRQGLPFNILKPLIIEQMNKALQIGAHEAQTGPASRNDINTLENHHDYLSYNEQLAEIYRIISQDIIDGQQF
jgi:predicted short-subunit dehydrogenase-like oxidoreductase (DUF2520 family)